ncbi:MAG: chromosome segregation protein SMC [Phycisphaerae bacterium]
MRLNKLILSGFKSFADKTEFEFDEGVSAVVGPNGCGKSNVVDAVKWVLGERSAKSLRGSEMMDVIFNGSSARKASGMAEVTLVFDNSSGQLQPDVKKKGQKSDSKEVSVTRRLFRSGQSEYLINKIPARLKDIQEMFLDTGVRTDGYSVIEQGRVSEFLQASQSDRRAIFDEAAGISKYKARRKEALRKLERVEQNLLRVNDILQEVEKRLRSIKYQAGKARNYQTYTEELAELRSLHFLAQYHTLKDKRKRLQDVLDRDHDRLSSINSRIDQLEAARSATEVESVDLERTARELQGQVAGISGQITTCQQRADMMTNRMQELSEQILQAARRAEELEAKIESFSADFSSREDELQRMETNAAELAEQYQAVHDEYTEGEMMLTELNARLEDEKAGTIDILRRVSQLHNEINGLGIRRENLSAQQQRLMARAGEIDESLAQLLSDRQEVESRLVDIRKVLGDSQSRLDETKQQSRQAADSEQQLRNTLSEAREQRSATISRTNALKEMQKRLEGVGAGVKRVLKAREQGGLTFIAGMLGEFLRSDSEHAPLVEAALAGADQELVVRTLDELRDNKAELDKALGDNGSVEVLCVDRMPEKPTNLPAGGDGVIGRVSDWVTCEDWVRPAVDSLLGATLAVETLEQASALLDRMPAGSRLVTRDGDVLETDGRVRVGAARKGAGVVTRMTELAELEKTLGELDERIETLQDRCQSVKTEREHLENVQQQLRTAIYEANTERVEAESKLSQYNEQIERLQREKPVVARDVEDIAEQIDQAVAREHEATEKADQLETLNTERQGQIEQLSEQIETHRARQTELNQKLTETRVAVAQAEEKKVAIRDSINSLRRQREQMENDLQAARDSIELNRRRKADAEEAISTAREEADTLYEQQQTLSAEAEEVEETRTGLKQRLDEIRNQVNQQRKTQENAGGELNNRKVELSEVDVRIENLISRASEEMSMELVELYGDYEHDEQRDWDEVARQIDELRGKIKRLGNVNLDAITEQEELEQRHEFLAGQLRDIEASQQQLEELIKKLNDQSRELFTRTFADIRENFRMLFRKLFGGGKADVLLTEPEDVLESPIEIVARPPGKETRSLSLLSGGEKAMTALALLFSMFKSKPSPFTILDEVDAPLDEANTERFSHLLQEFVDMSQFIVITHAKRTMSMANVLYGVTMQEPGVSKRISVKFEEAKDLEEELEPVG